MVSREDHKHLSKDKKFVIPNFDEEAEMLEWAGVCFGEEDTYRLGKAIKRLAVMSGADRLRFVAKLFGSQKDYWVCSGACLAVTKWISPEIKRSAVRELTPSYTGSLTIFSQTGSSCPTFAPSTSSALA